MFGESTDSEALWLVMWQQKAAQSSAEKHRQNGRQLFAHSQLIASLLKVRLQDTA
jgi:hypothetical protein